MNEAERFPFGVPFNRRPPKGLTPVPGRPGWWQDADGVQRYIEPPKKDTDGLVP